MNRFALPAAALMLSLAACGGSPGTQTSVEPVPEVSQSSSAATAPATSDSDAAKAYFTALVTNDPEQIPEALKFAAPGSVAEAYANHLTYANQADLDGGTPDDEDTLVLDGADGVYGYCPEGAETDDPDCLTWENVRFAGGKVVDFTVKKIDISKRITLGSGDKVKAGKLADVTFLSAYQSVQSKSLFVVLQVKSKNEKIDLTSVYSAKYRDPAGRQGTATSANGPSDLDKDSIGNVAIIFKNAKPGGVLSLDISESDDVFESKTVKIKTA